MTKDAGAHVTCHHHPGIIRVKSHRMKVSERVGISCVSNSLQSDYLRSANARSRGGPSWRGCDEGGINDILQDDGSCDTRAMGQRVREQRRPGMTPRQVMTSSELEK